jgi:hypothetical protein
MKFPKGILLERAQRGTLIVCTYPSSCISACLLGANNAILPCALRARNALPLCIGLRYRGHLSGLLYLSGDLRPFRLTPARSGGGGWPTALLRGAHLGPGGPLAAALRWRPQSDTEYAQPFANGQSVRWLFTIGLSSGRVTDSGHSPLRARPFPLPVAGNGAPSSGVKYWSWCMSFRPYVSDSGKGGGARSLA